MIRTITIGILASFAIIAGIIIYPAAYAFSRRGN